MKTALHIFRRDLRIEDNTALNYALEEVDLVIPTFIFDPRQTKNNSYRSDNAYNFMLSALSDLNNKLKKKGGKLHFFQGIAEDVIEQILGQYEVDLVTFNKDYTPFSLKRDKKIESLCKSRNVEVAIFADALLQEPESVLKDNGEPYTVFSPFCKKAQKLFVRKPTTLRKSNFSDQKLKGEVNPKLDLIGGRAKGLRLLNGVKKLTYYETLRDFPAQNYTTHLSAHNKFGTISIREVYHEILSHFPKNHTLLTELYWRDFFTHIAYHYPHVFKGAFRAKYDKILWKKGSKSFKAWCEGKTGFPIVDAGMRELNETGYMHNRVRMITASFLVKDLHIDWRMGEKYFAQKLIDYDPSVNNGNWQWAASTGCDAQPYFRVFNPYLQQEKFDPKLEYVNKWCKDKTFKPIVDHKIASKEIIAIYKACS